MSTLYDQAVAARLVGETGQAVALCQEILAEAPEDAPALALMSLSLTELGEVETGREGIRMALSLAPDDWRVTMRAAMIEQGTEQGFQFAQRAAQSGHDSFEAQGYLGSLLVDRGQVEAGIRHLKRAAEIEPRHVGIALKLALAIAVSGDLAEAARLLRAGPPGALEHVEAQRVLMQDSYALGQWADVIQHAETIAKIVPRDQDARLKRAQALRQQSKLSEARSALQDITPGDELAVETARLAFAYREAAAAEKALAVVSDQHPDRPYQAARVAAVRGQIDEAIAFARQALALYPRNVDAAVLLTHLTDGADDAAYQTLAATVDSLRGPSALAARFALGHRFHHEGAFEQAWESWSQANALQADALEAAGACYDPGLIEQHDQQLRTLLDGKEPAAEIAAPRPIFVVGVPRSGLSLVETALAGHPAISAMGPLPYMRQAAETIVRTRKVSLDHIKRTYVAALSARGVAPGQYFVDSQPENDSYLPLLRLLFPGAPVVRVVREARETALSLFRHNLGSGCPYAVNLSTIHHAMAAHLRRWEAEGEAGVTLSYEAFARDLPKGQDELLSQLQIEPEQALPPADVRSALFGSAVPHVRRSSNGVRKAADAYAEQLSAMGW
ncbi:MAG: sulfotransferase [Pseudomonadota bacterium]